MTAERTLEQAQELAFVALLAERNPGLDPSRPIGEILPYNHAGLDSQELLDHTLAFNIDQVPSEEALIRHAEKLFDAGKGWMKADIIFPDGTSAQPQGAYSTATNEPLTSHYIKEHFHVGLKVHAKRAADLKKPTAQAFDAAWPTGAKLRAVKAKL